LAEPLQTSGNANRTRHLPLRKVCNFYCLRLRFLFFVGHLCNMKFADVLRRLDAYPRTLDDFSVRTVGGAAGGCR